MYGRNGSRLTHSLSNTTHEYKIKGLSSLTTYTIDVAAVTAAGAGLATSSTISSGVPPGQYNPVAVSLRAWRSEIASALGGWQPCARAWGPSKEERPLPAGAVGWQVDSM